MALRRELTFLSVFTQLPKASSEAMTVIPGQTHSGDFQGHPCCVPAALCTSGSCRGSSAFPGTRCVSEHPGHGSSAPALPQCSPARKIRISLAVEVLHAREQQHRVPSRTEVGTAVPAPALVTVPEVSPCSVNTWKPPVPEPGGSERQQRINIALEQ